MKITKIYSDIKTFREIKFNDNFNLVCWISDDYTWWIPCENSVWKTSLLELIDFLLLNRKSEFKRHLVEKIWEWNFLIELELKDGLSITILRHLKNSSSICIKEHNKKNMNFISIIWDEKQWNYQNLWTDKAIKIINSYFTINQNVSYRKYIWYILRKQWNYWDVFKIYNSKDSEWKPPLYKLLWFNEDFLIKKYKSWQNIEILKSQVKGLWELDIDNKNIEEENNIKKDKLIKELDKLKKEIETEPIASKDFDTSVVNRLVQDVDEEINTINNEIYLTKREIELINNSIIENGKVNLNWFKSFFNELHWLLPEKWEELENRIKDVGDFQIALTKERTIILKEKKDKLTNKYSSLIEKRKNLDLKKENLLNSLYEKNIYKKFTLKQKRVWEILNELESLNENISYKNIINFYEEKLNQETQQESSMVKELKNAVQKNNHPKLFEDISSLFWTIFSNVFNKDMTAYIDVSINSNNNIDFDVITNNTHTQDKNEIYNWDAAQKILCFCFCLAVLITYKKNDLTFFNFTYMDWLFDWVSNDIRKNCISEMKKYWKLYNIQFIISAIQSDIPQWSIDDKDISLKLSNDNKLFWVNF